jgi:glutaredoxin-like protein
MAEVLQGSGTSGKSGDSAAAGGTITMYSTRWCGDCRRAKRWFDAHGIAYDVIDIDHDDQAANYVIQVNGGMRSVPTIVFPDGSVLVEPSSRELEAQWHHLTQPAETSDNTSDTTKQSPSSPEMKRVSYPRFASLYNWMMRRPLVGKMFNPLRREIAGHAHGVVLEVGVGGGQNFSWYVPAQVTRVEAVEPDAAMLVEARRAQATASVPITVTQARAESLPFADNQFDSVVVTMVFCSVQDPARGLREIRRVLKPGGTLLLLEHVRSHSKGIALLQDALVPLTTRCLGNCHWNRDTRQLVLDAGFESTEVRELSGGLQPMLLVQAIRPAAAPIS